VKSYVSTLALMKRLTEKGISFIKKKTGLNLKIRRKKKPALEAQKRKGG